MNDSQKKYLKAGGILCAIGAVSALLITGTNVLTAPIIAANNKAKEAAAYQAIYTATASVSDAVTVSGKYVSSYVVASDTSGTVLGTIYTGTASYGQTVNMKIMVGISGAKAKPVLGKVSILNNGATGGFDTTVVSAYVNPYNNDPSDTTLAAVKCGATAAATSIKLIVDEAKDLYSSGGAVEDIGSELKTIFTSEASYDDPKDISGATYAKKYYSVYSDAEKTTYLGPAYRFEGTTSDGTLITMMTGVNGSVASPEYLPMVIVSNSGADITADVSAYNAAPSADKLTNWSVATTGTLVKAMVDEARSLYSAGTGNNSLEGYSLHVYSALKSIGPATTVEGGKLVDTRWAAYSDQAGSVSLGTIYHGSGTSEGFTPYDGAGTHYSHITLIVGISGTTDAPVLGKMYLISDDSFDGSGIEGNYVTDYNTSPSETTLGQTTSTGATYSANLIKSIVSEALADFKGGK